MGMEERYLLPLQPLFPFVVSPQQDTHVGWNGAFDKANASISSDLSAAASRTACWCVYAVQLQLEMTNTEVRCRDCREKTKPMMLCCVCSVYRCNGHVCNLKNALGRLMNKESHERTCKHKQAACTKLTCTQVALTTAETEPPPPPPKSRHGTLNDIE